MISRPLQSILVNRWLAWLLVLPLFGMAVATTAQYRGIEAETAANRGKSGSLLVTADGVRDARILNDYEDFYIVGRLYREGDIIAAYDNDYLTIAQQRFAGSTTFMPWAYPPTLTALVPLLPVVGLSWSYLLFIVATLALYVATLVRFGARYLGASMLAVYPALMLNVRLGQNGLLTGALVGMILLGLRQRGRSGGFALGFLAIKPHLAVALGLLALLQRRWAMLAVAAAVVLVSSALATLVLGWEVWPAFLSGVAAAGGYLREGLFPLYRMSSVYAGLRSFGLPATAAMALHATVAVLALGTVVLAWRRGLQTDRLVALASTATVLVSPYNYDYDLAGLAAAFALLLPQILVRARSVELLGLYVLAWLATGAGLAQHLNAVLIAGTTRHPSGSWLNGSLQGASLILATALVCLILRRDERAGAAHGAAHRRPGSILADPV